MGLVATLTGRDTVVRRALAEAAAATARVELLQESIAELELAMEDAGWSKVLSDSETEYSREGLGRAARLCRVFAVGNPLIKRGLSVRQAYVFGQGVEVRSRAFGKEDGQQNVNAVIKDWWDEETNQAAVFGAQAQETLERALGTDGNVFLACFTGPATGRVLVRSLPFDEVQDVITNPEDKNEPWFYKRVWSSQTINYATGAVVTEDHTDYYPALGYFPPVRPRTLSGHEVHWDSPVLHVKVNHLDGWKFGVGDAYAALTWARAYRDFLADWATLVKSLSQFAWRATTGKRSASQKMREALARRPAGTAPAGNLNHAGATAVLGEDVTLEAIPKTGATIDSESGRPLATMVASALEIPVTTLLSDPGQTGARAVAETLNLPTHLAMQQRQKVWGAAYTALATYAIQQAIKAPRGALKGSVVRDPVTRREIYTLSGGNSHDDQTIEVFWPELNDVPVDVLMRAIVEADATGKMPPLETLKQMLAALNIRDSDEILETVTDSNGNWVDPAASAGRVAADAFRRGEDPAEALGY